MIRRFSSLVLGLLLLGGAALGAQTKARQKRPNPAVTAKPSAARKTVTEARADVVAKTNEVIERGKEFKAATEQYIATLAPRLKYAEERVEQRKLLVREGLVAPRELEQSQTELAVIRTEIEAQRQKIAEADTLIAEAEASRQLLLLPPDPVGTFRTTHALIRYNGGAAWSLSSTAALSGFFQQRFGRVLPISAYGQTATHERLGFNHHDRVDVAVHPDSSEGQALMSYLRERGIPFIAFRQAVPGSATGAHIHIGPPSHRLAR